MPASRTRIVILAVLIRSAPGLSAGDLERARELLRHHNYPDGELLEGTELFDLAGRPAVRAWMLERVREYLQKGELDEDSPQLLFGLLVMTGGTAEEVKVLAQHAAKSDGSSFAILARQLLENGPFSLSPAIEAQLLGPLVDRAAATLDAELANCVWLLAHRLSWATVRERLRSAMRSAGSAVKSDPRMVRGEILVQMPDGKPFADLGWTQTLGAWTPSTSILWPDGKVRFRYWLSAGEGGHAIEIQLAVPGYRAPQKTSVQVQEGKPAKLALTLGERRLRVRGKVSPAPRTPLFARLESGLTLGRPAVLYRENGGELTAPLRADGAFEAPVHSRGKKLLLFDAAGRIVAAVDPPAVADDGDLELGEVKLPVKRELVDVPVLVEWPRGLPRGRELQASIEWKPEDRSLPRGSTHCYRSSGVQGAQPIRIGLARNLPPGKYAVKARFHKEEGQAEVPPIEMSFTVEDSRTPLVLRPASNADAPEPSPAQPAEAADAVATGWNFRLRASGSGRLYLLANGDEGVTLRIREDGKFGAPQVLLPKSTGEKGKVGHMELLVTSDESLHVLLQASETEFHDRILYARIAPDSRKAPRWLPVADGNSPVDSYSFPTLWVRKKDLIEVFLQAESLRMDQQGLGNLQNLRIVNGFLQNGGYRHVRSIRMDNGPFAVLMSARIIGEPAADPQALYLEGNQPAKLSWTGLKRFQPQPAAALPLGASYTDAELTVASDGTVYLAVPIRVQEKPSRYQIWVARGKPGRPLEARGLLPELLPGPATSLSSAPDGKVYLLAGLPRLEGDHRQIALWCLSGPFPPPHIPTRWIARLMLQQDPLHAVFTSPTDAVLAWSSDRGIYVEKLSLQDGDP